MAHDHRSPRRHSHLKAISTLVLHFQRQLGAFERTLDMIPTFTSPVPANSSAMAQTAQKTAFLQAQTARTSAGESAAANIRPETTRAIDAPDQAVVAQRLRDQETKQRADSVIEEFAGPEPTFEESPLERQAPCVRAGVSAPFADQSCSKPFHRSTVRCCNYLACTGLRVLFLTTKLPYKHSNR